MSCAKAIGILGNQSDVKPLAQWLKAESDVLVHIWIVASLGRLGGKEAVSSLLEVLQCTDSSTLRYTVIRALGDLGDPVAIPLIEGYLEDEDRHVRQDAEDALARLRGTPKGEMPDGQ